MVNSHSSLPYSILGSHLTKAIFLFAAFGLTGLYAEPSVVSIVDQFTTASRNQQHVLDGASMDVNIEASLPKLKKQGKLHALRRISKLGRITYEALRFEGDNTVKNNVIARYLAAETESQKEPSEALAVTPANYRFKYKRETELEGRTVYVMGVTPKKKKVGLYNGEIWIDAQTFLRVRESGRFVKTPSIFLKKIEFVRNYDIKDGVSVPREIRSLVDTRLVGAAELTIAFSNIALINPALDSERRALLAEADAQ